MCLFPVPNTAFDSIAYKKGVTHFDCGACPECLQRRSALWALRAVYEAMEHEHNCMITLTYDNFVYDDKGNIIGETPVNPDLKVNKRDIQLFIKRLRKWHSGVSSESIKYIACAEYGSRTHRAHYHCILFGVDFSDIHFYKKSKRGNPIFMSNTLTDLWHHGICTVDSISVRSAIARYCTKYCAKSRSDETFMLCSQKIGLNGLLRDFNGYNYMIDGREYTIPRIVWEHFITEKYKYCGWQFSPKYVNNETGFFDDPKYVLGSVLRQSYRDIRDNDPVYQRYLDYWHDKSLLYESRRHDPRTRILQLREDKYHAYKVKALKCFDMRNSSGIHYIAPGSNAGKGLFERDCFERSCRLGLRYHSSLADPSRHNTASDTIQLPPAIDIRDYPRAYALSLGLLPVPDSDFPCSSAVCTCASAVTDYGSV